MRRMLSAALLATSLVLAVAQPAGADPPSEVGPFVDVFEDVDPCTGLVHTVTIEATFFVHSHDRMVARGERTLSTSSGYEGSGSSSFVLNGRIEMFRSTDILTDPSGNRIRANVLFVLDVPNDAVRVDQFSLTCLGA